MLTLLYGPTLTFVRDYLKNCSFDYTDLCWQSGISAFCENIVKVHKKSGADTKTAVTGYKVIAETGDMSLLEIRLITGRTHQIRATFSAIGHPLLGDGKYAVNKEDRKKGYNFQQLCSYSVEFKFKTDKGVLNYLNGKKITAKTPDFIKLFE